MENCITNALFFPDVPLYDYLRLTKKCESTEYTKYLFVHDHYLFLEAAASAVNFRAAGASSRGMWISTNYMADQQT